jgi:hypothetical protein
VDPDPAFQENPERHRFVADPDPTIYFDADTDGPS